MNFLKGNNMENCIFCKIANKKISTDIVYEDEKTMVFKDLNPQAPTHLLVIPKEHIKDINELENPELMVNLIQTIKKITQNENIKEYRIVANTGKQAGQEIFHLHFHILANRQLNGLG